MKYSYTQLHFHKSAQFLKPTPRTFREAFGYSLEDEKNHHKHILIYIFFAFIITLFCLFV